MTTMSVVEIGNIVDGVVTGITNFGAFIQLPDGKTGLCHISEIADNYVKSVSDHLKESQQVKVKVISLDEKGKVSLSIRQAEPKAEQTEGDSRPAERSQSRPAANGSRDFKSNGGSRDFKPHSGSREFSGGGREFKPHSKPFGGNKPTSFSRNEHSRKPENFEDMLNGFLKDSDDKLKTIKKAAKSTRKGNGYNNR